MLALQTSTREVNSADKTVRGHKFKVTGLSELVAGVLNVLNPADVLRFAKRRTWSRRDAPNIAAAWTLLTSSQLG